ncbi:dihydrolipoamide acetyltransferase family protein [Sphaerobacter sp.]|uniref:dihydrolipoamide acetyltransferase family protein n=1 Tax=Sphaerobacter sp. TaxID=2099654 RepID=UPI001DC195C8|nr:dihydrolipoamide acetyltransferase family protein [Sphaerobacter sp.]MBX5446816.1 2-oxo acid dehydrogenase subunit E2 [Sphaerobacter sp.]
MSTTRHGTVVRLPKLGESVTEGTIGTWLKQVGDRVEKYDPLVEITTDKVNAEVPSPVSGILTEIRAAEGDTLPVGAEICVIAEEGTEAPTAEAAPEVGAAAQDGINGGLAAGPAPGRAPKRTGRESAEELLRTRSSPAVRRIAEEHGIDISQVPGTGLSGRVTKQDILRYIAAREAQPAAAAAPEREATAVDAAAAAIQETAAPPKPAEVAVQPETPALRPAAEIPAEQAEIPIWEGDQIVPVTPMRKQIAAHMVRSERTAPHVTLWMEVDMSGVVEARARAQERFRQEEGFELTFLPFVVKAVVHALREHPRVNAVWDEDRIILRKAINIGIAVGMEDGLIVPVIKNADEKSIVGLARAIRDLATRARNGQLTLDDVQGGTFTVNNPGTFGTILSTPIIVQPQSAILSTEAVVKRPVVIDDAIAIRPMMNLSLSFDHRILDGLAGARFLATVKQWLEAFRPDTPLY